MKKIILGIIIGLLLLPSLSYAQNIPNIPIKTFLGLQDTPDTYSGQAGKMLWVNASTTALEFVATSSLGITQDLSGYVPYTGATTNLTLGTNDLTANYIRSRNAVSADGNWRTLNKAGSNWVTWGTRNTSGVETVLDINSGTISASGRITTPRVIVGNLTDDEDNSLQVYSKGKVFGSLTNGPADTIASANLDEMGYSYQAEGHSFTYQIYPYFEIGGNKVFSANPAQTTTLTDAGSLSTYFYTYPYADYMGSAYSGEMSADYYIYVKKDGIWSYYADYGSFYDDGLTGAYNVNMDWGDTSADLYAVYKYDYNTGITSYYETTGLSAVDDGTWATTPSSQPEPYYYDPIVGWDIVAGVDGYRVVKDYNGSGFVEYADTTDNFYLDDGFSWAYDPSLTFPNTTYLNSIFESDTFKSTIETGKPFDILSTTLNDNLNADLLDGLHATSFLQAEADTLQTVTGRGNSTTNAISIQGANIANSTGGSGRFDLTVPAESATYPNMGLTSQQGHKYLAFGLNDNFFGAGQNIAGLTGGFFSFDVRTANAGKLDVYSTPAWVKAFNAGTSFRPLRLDIETGNFAFNREAEPQQDGTAVMTSNVQDGIVTFAEGLNATKGQIKNLSVGGTTLGTEMLQNGTFTGSATSWTVPTGMAYSANTVIKNANGTGALVQPIANMTIPFQVGHQYTLVYSIQYTAPNTNNTMTPTACGVTLPKNGQIDMSTGLVTFTHTFTCVNATSPLTFTPRSSGNRFTIDSISVKKITDGAFAAPSIHSSGQTLGFYDVGAIAQPASTTAIDTTLSNLGLRQTGGNANFDTAITTTQLKLSALNTAPATATSTGVLGEIRVVADYIYVCTATNTWVRSALTTW